MHFPSRLSRFLRPASYVARRLGRLLTFCSTGFRSFVIDVLESSNEEKSTNRLARKSSVHEILRARWHASGIRKPVHGSRDAVWRDCDVILGFCDLRSGSAPDRG